MALGLGAFLYLCTVVGVVRRHYEGPHRGAVALGARPFEVVEVVRLLGVLLAAELLAAARTEGACSLHLGVGLWVAGQGAVAADSVIGVRNRAAAALSG